ncbi:fluoride efflux transporter CrcB [Kouleothrix sp.]|uniref:fluoride efflux transporter CrcB n=1 Tax=Kouleothrix sp. TaxID=2779161 RepID=UPI00391A8551
MSTILILALGATVGAALRYYGSLWAASLFGPAFPYGTLIINVSGSFILGCFLTLATERLAISPQLRLLVATGFCGSYTTFSTFSYEAVGLLTKGSYLAGGAYLLGSVALGVAAVVAGAALARALPL